ncbi:AI-2E family transporter [Candidatus Pacearchaeota archaeon]|nr:AI-2E family transporter [Candidatus Pacearchaeota archaeon]
MSSEMHFNRVIAIILVIGLIILSAIILKPIFFSIVTGLLLAYVFNPVYKKIYSFVRERNTSAFVIIFIVLLIIFIPFWFLFPVITRQIFEFFIYLQKIDIMAFVRQVFPPGVFSEVFYANLGASVSGFVGKLAGSMSASFSSFIVNIPNSMLHALIVLFTLFYALKDSSKFGEYIKSVSPFSEKTEQRMMQEFKNITKAVIYGSVLTGIILGIVVGIGFFIFGVPGALILTLLAVIMGILPILGVWMVWAPAAIYLMSTNNVVGGVLLTVYSLIITFVVDGIIRTYFISKTGKMHSAIVLIGMIGGLFTFGILGFIIGPLILSYLLIIFDAYRNKNLSGLFS